MRRNIIMSSRVRLARNYEDLPFDTARRPEAAAQCVQRTASALRASRLSAGFDLLRLNEMSEISRRAMAESRLISQELLETPDTTAVFLRTDETMTVMMNEEDHLRIQAFRQGLDLPGAAQACFQVDDVLSRQAAFAFDEQLGYLTACPTNTGTGMRASILLHLPMLTKGKQMGNVGQLVSKVGLNIRGVYGEGSEALGHVYQISNQVTLGRTEQDLINAVSAVGVQLCDMEAALRGKAYQDGRTALEDLVYRAWGMLEYARIMPLREFYQHWSLVRLGAAMGLLSLDVEAADAMLDQVQDAHLCLYADEPLSGQALEECRATRIREMIHLAGGKQIV